MNNENLNEFSNEVNAPMETLDFVPTESDVASTPAPAETNFQPIDTMPEQQPSNYNPEPLESNVEFSVEQPQTFGTLDQNSEFIENNNPTESLMPETVSSVDAQPLGYVEPVSDTMMDTPILNDMAAPVQEPQTFGSVNNNSYNSMPELMGEPTFNPSDNDNYEYHKPKSKKGLVAILGVVLVVILGVGGFFGYQLLFGSPYTVYQGVIKGAFATYRPYVENDINNMSAMVSGNVKVESTLEELSFINGYSFDYGVGFDIPNKKAEVMFGLTEKDKNVLDAYIYLLNNKGYIKSEKLFNYLLDSGEEIPLDFDIDYPKEDVMNIYNLIEQVLLKSVPSKYFNKDKANVNGIKVTANTITLNENNLETILENAVDIIEKDSKAIESIAKLSNSDKNDIIKALDEFDIDSEDIGEGEAKIIIYSKGLFNKVVGFSLEAEGVKYVDYVNDNGNGYIKINGDGDFDIEGTIKDNVTTLKVTIYGQTLPDIKITKKAENSYVVECTYDGYDLLYEYTSKEEGKDVVTNDILVKVGNKDGSVSIKLHNKTEMNKSIADIDTKDAKKIADLTESEMEKITTNLEKIIKDLEIYPMISSLIDNLTTIQYGNSYDDQYGYESDFDFDNEDLFSDIEFEDIYYDDSDMSSNNTSESYNEACEYASCTKCNGSTCQCEYYDIDFNLKTITCPNR